MPDPHLPRPPWLQSLLQGPDATCIETHVSWVLLAGAQAVKFKKPLKLDFLDFSTLAQRRAACVEELRINRRTAPQLYQAVVALLGPAQAPRLVPLERLAPAQQGQVLDYGVQMQRFGDGQLLARQLAAGTLQADHLAVLAERVAQLHASAAPAPGGSAWGSAALVRQQAQANLDALAALPLPAAERRAVQALADWTRREGDRLHALMAARQAAGQVRECHGDLHLGNLVLLEDGPQLFDAIEFNAALRFIDPMADVAFLCMDLQAHGRPDLGWHFLNRWLEHAGDYAGLALLPWYLVYRALVRAMVAGLRWAQAPRGPEGDGPGEGAASLRELRRYLALAEQLHRPRARWLWLAQGVSGAGKSHHSAPLVAARGVVRLRADVERKRLFGLAPTASSAGAGGVAGGIYSADATGSTYARLLALARQVLEAGFPVLVDATFLARAQRAPFLALAAQWQLPCRILAFDAPAPVLQARVQWRLQQGGDASEATLEVLQAQLARREPLGAQEAALALHVDTAQAVDWAALLPPAWDAELSAPAAPATATAARSS
ncbi:bifunctional aminoglycoside phosphotransferase/ATP-binding protein [Acidovorax sp. SRB_24]|uniref:bifunctional aminoglycoside phosphotransferase/ATP-binding protein n=1 Tax=Acidovorax sp. SRB_24 TaxID=1962700 RepID=UPI00145F6CB3|nr:hypothetical protein [Acidovorax sp. SRB_24]